VRHARTRGAVERKAAGRRGSYQTDTQTDTETDTDGDKHRKKR